MSSLSPSNFRTVLEFPSLQEGYDYCRKNGPNPFIVRNCTEFLLASHEQIISQMKLETSIHGYNTRGKHAVRGRVAYNTWLNNSLDFNIVDSSSSRGSLLLPQLLKDLNIANDVESMLWLSYVLTLANVQSKVHIDPPFGSGWQYLSEGSKCWTIVDSEFFGTAEAPVILIPDIPLDAGLDLAVFCLDKTARFVVASRQVIPVPVPVPVAVAIVTAPTCAAYELAVVVPVPVVILLALDTDLTESMTDPMSPATPRRKYPTKYVSTQDYNLDDMATEYPQELYRVVLNATDFLSCPANWPHAVYTIDKTCGLSGYMKYANSA